MTTTDTASEWMIIHHDCHMMDHGHTTIGPFPSKDEAEGFIERRELWMPMEGGYAFATAVPVDGREMMEVPDDEYYMMDDDG